jgi:peptide/nickel transport system permease protein
MLNFLAQRLASAFLVLVLVSALSFGIIWLVPGDPTAVLLDANTSPEQVARLRAQLGLDKPLPAADRRMVRRILRGDLGQSILLNRSVMAAILERLPVTLALAGISLLLAVVLGVAAGSSRP